jgi:predicted DNA-binding transcriptional regulator AlpA
MSTSPTLLPLLIDAKALADLLSVSPATVWRLHSAGKVPMPLKLAGSTRWRLDEIRQWLDAGLPDRKTWQALREDRP